MYPVGFQADYQASGRNRVTVLFRYFCLIPLAIVAYFWEIVGGLSLLVTWFAVVITGKYPEGLYEFNGKVLRYFVRYNAYAFLLTDAYPPFGGADDPSYPIRVPIGPAQESYSRLKAFFRFLLVIPSAIVSMLWGIAAFVVVFLSWFVLLFTAKHPEGMFTFVRNYSAYATRVWGYAFLLTDAYPPINEEPQVAAAAPVG
jgi:hypothetical protein